MEHGYEAYMHTMTNRERLRASTDLGPVVVVLHAVGGLYME